jgi:hypothetical protein
MRNSNVAATWEAWHFGASLLNLGASMRFCCFYGFCALPVVLAHGSDLRIDVCAPGSKKITKIRKNSCSPLQAGRPLRPPIPSPSHGHVTVLAFLLDEGHPWPCHGRHTA